MTTQTVDPDTKTIEMDNEDNRIALRKNMDTHLSGGDQNQGRKPDTPR